MALCSKAESYRRKGLFVMTDGLLLYTLQVITMGCLEERFLTSVHGLGLGVVA